MSARAHILTLILIAITTIGTMSVAAQPATGSRPPLVVEAIEVAGNKRTSASRVHQVAGIADGDFVRPDALLDAADRLRSSHLFRDANVHARPGSEPGKVVVVFEVEENRPHVRLGAGYEDFSGWYLIPIEANFDNLTGRGERFHLRSRIGHRVAGLILDFEKPRLDDPRHYWGLRLRSETGQRLYYLNQVETAHDVGRGGLDFRIGRILGRDVALEGWLSSEVVDPTGTIAAYSDNETAGVSEGDDVEFADLPDAIQDDIDRRGQFRAGVAINVDTRVGTDLTATGVRLRGSAESVTPENPDENAHFGIWQLDARAYAELSRGLQIAARGYAGAMGSAAPFYERFYVGGIYTVRGFPSQSLSPPEGNRYIATASLELRSLWAGTPERPKLSGLLFLDTGIGWDEGSPDRDLGAGGIGFGFRVRLPWIQLLGVDVGVPLSPSPIEESFHGNLSLGWTF